MTSKNPPKILEYIEGMSDADLVQFVEGLSDREIRVLFGDWSLWALGYQRIPDGDWRRWIARVGRGGGKTYSGARATNEVASDRKKIRRGEVGIIGRTYTDARQTMVEGPSGILQTASPDFMPRWEPGNGLLVWPNGVRGRVFSADKPEGLRGPNFAWVWADEVCHWQEWHKTWWETIEPALRIGWARAMITTTPLPDPQLVKMESLSDTVVTRGSTFDNLYLHPDVREGLRKQYAGTRIGKQELEGEILEANERALWRIETLERSRVDEAPEDLQRVVVAVDPAGSRSGDEIGIVVAGKTSDDHAYIVEDCSLHGRPHEWAAAAITAYRRHNADIIVAERNYGGDMVEAVIRNIDPRVSYRSVHARRGKYARAEPVAAAYERGVVHHLGVFPELEKEMTTWSHDAKWSPNRLDALVYAVTELIVDTDAPGPLSAYYTRGRKIA